nr:MAG TPA: hypothetical protein [Caudoviricetes sp.]
MHRRNPPQPRLSEAKTKNRTPKATRRKSRRKKT